MKKILLRAGKSPFEVFGPYETFRQNIIGNNNGNLVFAAAAYKLLSTGKTEITTKRNGFNKSFAEKANEQFDVFVLPLANAFRPSFAPELERITDFIENLKIPTVMLSGGAQSGKDGTFKNLEPIKDTVQRFCRAVLKGSSHITVRGEQTRDYIRSLGFEEVIVIGCPSMTMNGPNYTLNFQKDNDIKNVAYNVQTNKQISERLYVDIEKNYKSFYFPQDMETMEMMLWGVDKFTEHKNSVYPYHSSHIQFESNKSVFNIDFFPWMKMLKGMDVSVGPRIHGNIVSILAGTPAVVLAHDSRTLELAEYHKIPHFKPSDLDSIKSLKDVLDVIDYSEFNSGLSERFWKVISFLNDNGLDTIYNEGNEEFLKEYERAVVNTSYPEPARVEWRNMSLNEFERLKADRINQVTIKRLQDKINFTEKKLEVVSKKLSNLQVKLDISK